MFASFESTWVIWLAILITGIVEARFVVSKEIKLQEISKTDLSHYTDFYSKFSKPPSDEGFIINNAMNNHDYNKIRRKRSPYPPGFVIWSPPSEVVPCHCSPGDRKCKCLKLLERVALRSRRRTVNRRRG